MTPTPTASVLLALLENPHPHSFLGHVLTLTLFCESVFLLYLFGVAFVFHVDQSQQTGRNLTRPKPSVVDINKLQTICFNSACSQISKRVYQ